MATTGHWHDDRQSSDEFRDPFNVTPSAISTWLDTDESKAVGQKKDGTGESTGHHLSSEIIALLQRIRIAFGKERGQEGR